MPFEDMLISSYEINYFIFLRSCAIKAIFNILFLSPSIL